MIKLILLDSRLQEDTVEKLININLSSATKLILLDLLLPEVTTGAIYICTSLKL